MSNKSTFSENNRDFQDLENLQPVPEVIVESLKAKLVRKIYIWLSILSQ